MHKFILGRTIALFFINHKLAKSFYGSFVKSNIRIAKALCLYRFLAIRDYQNISKKNSFSTLLPLTLCILVLFICCNTSLAQVQSKALTGVVSEDYKIEGNQNTVYDASTGEPISNAVVEVPSKGISTRTNDNGNFKFNYKSNKPLIMSIKAQGYKPFSLTIKNFGDAPLKLALKKSGHEIVIDSEIRHLGDNSFSPESANAGDFRLDSTGPIFNKSFYLKSINLNNEIVLRIGSIIGLDTELAKRLNQSGIQYNYSSSTKIYLNNKEIGEIKINGDDQEMIIPKNILKLNSYNHISVKTGKSVFDYDFPDYDDMEFINLIIEVR